MSRTAAGSDLYTQQDLIYSFFCTLRFENHWARLKGKFLCRQIPEHPPVWVFKTTLKSLVEVENSQGLPLTYGLMYVLVVIRIK